MTQPPPVRRFVRAAALARTTLLWGALAFLTFTIARATRVGVQRCGWWNPLLVVEPQEINLGIVAADAIQHCRFVVRNSGQRPLRIERIRIGCSSCMNVARAPTMAIPPHGSGTIVAEFKTHGLLGPTIRTLAIESNDPTRPSMVLKIKADVRRLGESKVVVP